LFHLHKVAVAVAVHLLVIVAVAVAVEVAIILLAGQAYQGKATQAETVRQIQAAVVAAVLQR
jgi:hypothetical protein